MRKRVFLWETAGFFFVAAAGTLLHFLYDRSGGSVLAAVISGVNESTWEHMKLLFVPLFLFTEVQVCVWGQQCANLLAVRAVSTLTGLALIPILFYTYTGVLGYFLSWINIAIFYVSALAAFALDFRLLRRGRLLAPWQQLVGLAILWGMAFAFVWCTFRPPQLGLWKTPVTGEFGI